MTMKKKLQRVNRIYAVRDAPVAKIYKTGYRNGKPIEVRLSDCPLTPYIDNEGKVTIDMIDKNWYIQLAYKRINQFLGVKEKKMPRKSVTNETVEVGSTTRVDEPMVLTISPDIATPIEQEQVKTMTFERKLLEFFNGISSEAFPTDGYNSNQKYDYTKSATYKAVMRKYLYKFGLLFQMTDLSVQMESINKSDKMNLLTYIGQIKLSDVETGQSTVWTVMAQGSDMGDKGVSKAKTLAIKDWLKANALVYDGQDEPESSDGMSAEGDGIMLNTETVQVNSPAEKTAVKKSVVNDAPADAEDIAKAKSLIEAIRKASGDETYGVGTVKTIEAGITSAPLEVIIAKLEMKANSLGINC